MHCRMLLSCTGNNLKVSCLPARRYASVGISYGPVSVSLSVASLYSIEVVGRIKLVFGMEASFDQSYSVF